MNFCKTHSGDDPADGGRGHVLSFGLAHQRHAQVLDVEHHPLQQSLLGVRPVLRQLCNRGEPMNVTRESGEDLSSSHSKHFTLNSLFADMLVVADLRATAAMGQTEGGLAASQQQTAQCR